MLFYLKIEFKAHCSVVPRSRYKQRCLYVPHIREMKWIKWNAIQFKIFFSLNHSLPLAWFVWACVWIDRDIFYAYFYVNCVRSKSEKRKQLRNATSSFILPTHPKHRFLSTFCKCTQTNTNSKYHHHHHHYSFPKW